MSKEIDNSEKDNQSDDGRLEKIVRALDLKQRQLTQLADALPACISFIDKDYVYRLNNRTYELWFNTEKKYIVGKHAKDLLGEGRFIRIKPLLDRALLGETVTFEARRKFPDGMDRALRVNYIPAKDLEGDGIYGVYIFTEDITELKLAQDALERTNRELMEFSAVASHDMKAPLRMLSSFSELLEEEYRDKLDEEGRQYLKIIHDSSVQLSQLISDLLDHAIVGHQQYEGTAIALDGIMERVRANLLSDIRDSNAILDIPKGLPEVKMSETDALSLFQNLISNAIKYQPPGNQPRVVISLLDEGNTIQVKDNGIGIPENKLEEVFNPFFRLHSHSEYKGSGIGLSTCKKIAERYGFKLTAESVVGKGSTFSIRMEAK